MIRILLWLEENGSRDEPGKIGRGQTEVHVVIRETLESFN